MKKIFSTQEIKKYQGRYIAVSGGKIIASGKDAKETFRLAKKIVAPRKVDGIYYIPQKRITYGFMRFPYFQL